MNLIYIERIQEMKNNEKLSSRENTFYEPNDIYSIFSEKKNEENIPDLMINSPGEEKCLFLGGNSLLNKKTERNRKKVKKTHNKFSYDNLKRECKHLVIENVRAFVNKKILEAYNGNIGEGILKKELVKLNQSQKKNPGVEFNQLFINMTLKEIFSQKITKKIKLLNEDHNKKVIEKVLEEKKGTFGNLFNLTFIQCVEHFIGDKQLNELNGMTLFNELRDQIAQKYKDDGDMFYQNLEIFVKEFKSRINNAKPRKKRIFIDSNSST